MAKHAGDERNLEARMRGYREGHVYNGTYSNKGEEAHVDEGDIEDVRGPAGSHTLCGRLSV
jgi:hypothetical protein